MRGYEREAIRTGGGGVVVATVVGCVVVIGALLVAAMWVFGFGLFSKATAETRGETGAREQTQASGQYRVANYDDFFGRCNAIVALDQRIAQTKDSIAAGGADEAQAYVDRQALRGQQGQRADLAGQYNARAQATGTSGQFRDSRLPFSIGTETPTCG